MIDTLLGAFVGFALAVTAYEVLILSHVRREIDRTKRTIEALRPHVTSKPVQADLSDSSPSLHL
jgi:hypothetical protein